MKYNCPICNQAGLPDYKIQPIQCPQCNTDLKPYWLLNSIAKRQKRNKINKLIIAVLAITCLALLLLLSKNSADYKRQYNAADREIAPLLYNKLSNIKLIRH
ncbi:MAG: hypothetical protein LBP72_06090 [Dysgonamonadaceae bacterium]|jgi:hypothetical protein|nr:hypothetical protein [Dysgonamonadaceae bacterium]